LGAAIGVSTAIVTGVARKEAPIREARRHQRTMPESIADPAIPLLVLAFLLTN
jgi:hypothetical protein